jgi:hypothetical protein
MSKSGILRAIRLTFLIGFLSAVFSLIFVSVTYGVMREYIFEVIIISIVWLELIISSILLSIAFKKKIITGD